MKISVIVERRKWQKHQTKQKYTKTVKVNKFSQFKE